MANTAIYHWLFDFPGMNRFRVPKMFLFIQYSHLSVAAQDESAAATGTVLATDQIQRYLMQSFHCLCC